MSLINTMLRDLDKRRAGDDVRQSLPAAVRAIPDADRNGSRVRMAVLGGVLLLTAAAAWWWLDQEAPPPAVSLPAAPAPAVPKPAPAPAVVAVPPAPTFVACPPGSAPRAFQADVRAAEPKAEHPAAIAEPAIPPSPAVVTVTKKTDSIPAAKAKTERTAAAVPAVSALRLDEKLALPETPPAASETPKLSLPVATPRLPATSSSDPALASREADDWTRAQAMLREGRNDQAEPLLKRLLQAKPGNNAARQALLGILLPARRHPEAIAVLRDGLALNPEQISWAMNLARLHADAGDYATAWKVLDYSAPNARQNAEYLAFSGTVLQRLSRNGEAITHYRAALQIKPNEGRWWVGYGIALEAEGKPAEAHEAFRRALAVGDLSPEVTGFVEQKLR